MTQAERIEALERKVEFLLSHAHSHMSGRTRPVTPPHAPKPKES